nr:AC5 protein [Bitter gourd yellow mosaic virus]
MHVHHGSPARLVVKHVEDLAEILRLVNRPPTTNKEEHDSICVIFGLDVLVHPHLTQHVHRLDTETLADTMRQPGPARHVTNAHHLPNMGHVMPGLERLYLTRAFTAPWYIWASKHSVDPGLSVHGPVGPYPCLCASDNGDNCTGRIGAVEIQTSACLRGGR